MSDLKIGVSAPLFVTKQDNGETFRLAERKGKWTVLYFYPKADTPGCTKQACTYRDGIARLRAAGAEVFGISTDKIDDLVKFREKYQLNFPLLSDESGAIAKLYESKMPLVAFAQRHTFVIGPDLTLKAIDTKVKPDEDASRVLEVISKA